MVGMTRIKIIITIFFMTGLLIDDIY